MLRAQESSSARACNVTKASALLFTLSVLLLCAVAGAQQRSPQNRFDVAKPSVKSQSLEPHFPVLVDNARVRVSRVEISPNAETAMLPHEYDYLLVAIGATDLELVGSSSRFPVTMQDGEMQIIPGRWAHRFVNKADKPAQLVMIESRTAIKPDAAICGVSAEQCHQMNFAKDGATEYAQTTMFETPTMRLVKAELGAGTLLPKHEHGSDHLLVALSDMQLTADHDAVSRTQGNVYWHANGFATLKNTGDKLARFLLVEWK